MALFDKTGKAATFAAWYAAHQEAGRSFMYDQVAIDGELITIHGRFCGIGCVYKVTTQGDSAKAEHDKYSEYNEICDDLVTAQKEATRIKAAITGLKPEDIDAIPAPDQPKVTIRKNTKVVVTK